MMTLVDYLRLPWTVVRSDHNDDGEYLALHVKELPGFVVAARTAEEADAMFWDALREFLRTFFDAGEVPPIPEVMLPQRPQLELMPLSTVHSRAERTTVGGESDPDTAASGRAQFSLVA